MVAINLFEKYGKQSKPVNLLENYKAQPTNEENIVDPIKLARQKIKEKYPNMPEFLREGLLSLTPKEESPFLASAAHGISNVTDIIPATAGGLLQGASLPIRGVASFIPNEYAQKFAQSPNLTELFPKPEGFVPKTAQLGGELVGAGGLLGKLFQGAKSASQLAKIPKILQNPASLATTGAIATPGGKEEKSLGALEAFVLGGAGKAAGKISNKFPELMRGIFNKPNVEEAVQAVQNPHDKLLSTADELYGQVKSAIGKRNVKVPISDKYLEDAYDILGKTRANRKLIDAAKSGDYEAVHKLQSHLFKKGTKALTSDDIAIENQGEEIVDLRDKINEELENTLVKEGHLDIAHVLKQGKKAFAKLKDTYYDKNLRKSIGKMVNHELREIPEKPLDIFKQNSVPMKKFLDKHPEVRAQIEKEKERDQAMKLLKGLSHATGYGGATVFGGKTIYDWLK